MPKPDKISRDEYNRLKRHDHAGPKSSLLPQTQEQWSGSHWAMRNVKGATTLAPVDLED